MQIATISDDGVQKTVVRRHDGRLVEIPVADVVASLSPGGSKCRCSDMRRLIMAWSPAVADVLVEHVAAATESLAPETVEWLPPVVDPGKICGVAMNNSASNARKIAAPSHPAFFIKPSSSLVGHGQPIVVQRYYGSVHPEPELAVVIGRQIRKVVPEEVADAVFGFTIVNDVTGNAMRAEDRFHYYALYSSDDDDGELKRVEQHLSYAARYKGSDTFCAVGPFITLAADVENPDALSVSCWVGDEKIADDNTRYYNYKVAEVLSFLSYFQTLYPGDIVSLGTAFKPGATRKSIHHADLQRTAGPVAIEIDGLGRLENPVSVEDGQLGRWRLENDRA